MLGVASLIALGAIVGDGQAWGQAMVVLVLAVSAGALALWAPARATLAAVAAASFGLGVAAGSWERLAYERTPLRAWTMAQGSPRLVRVEGRAADDAFMREGQLVLVLDVARGDVDGRSQPLAGRLRVKVGGAGPFPTVHLGDHVRLWADVRAPTGFGNPGSVDPVRLARGDGVHAFGFCKSAKLVEVCADPDGAGWKALPAAARRWAREALLKALPAGPEAAIVVAMTLGDQNGLDRDTGEAFRVAGTYHVLALSGAQVALIAGALVMALRRLGVGPLAQGLVLTPALTFYALLVGGEVPIARATLMALVAVWGHAADLEIDVPNLLGVAAAALLLWQPSAIADVGFQLSFAGTLGILLLTPAVAAVVPRMPLGIDVATAASLASQLALWPLLAEAFHRLAPAALLLNLVAVPLSGMVLVAGLVLVGMSALSASLAAWLAPAAWWAAHLLWLSGKVVAAWPALDVRVPGPAPLVLLVYLAGLAGLVRPGRRRRAALLIAVSLAAMTWPAPPADGLLHVTLLDVGQGDAIVIRTPAGRAWAVDAGGGAGGFDLGEAVVGPYLWSLPVRRLEGLAVTHAHDDHVGGAPFLLRHFAPREVWEGPAPRADPEYRAFARAAQESAARRLSVGRGHHLDLDGVELEVVAPRYEGPPPLHTRNDDSLVLHLRFGGVGLLLTGDIEEGGEAALDEEATILKVPHHGSRTSSSARFLDRLAPRLALLSVGARNRFGHPHADVLDRYARRGIRVYRTDRDGAITVTTDGRRVWVETFREGGEMTLVSR
jgi:competence protein ComEC